jgi:hypothetical protein
MPSDHLEVDFIACVLHKICSNFDAFAMKPALPGSFGES